MNGSAEEERLREILRGMKSVAVAFSGGVDSTYLLSVAHEVLGDRAFAVTALAEIFPGRENEDAEVFCLREGIRRETFYFDPAALDAFAENPPDRCYLCKRALFTGMKKLAREHGAVLIDGTNRDDEKDYRPGMRALAELGVVSPLRMAGLTKAQIRELSRRRGLFSWDKPSMACLASRFAYGERITEEKLRMVEQAEDFLLALGFRQERVRIHGNLARIEVMPEEFPRLLSVRERIAGRLKELGFSYVTMDLAGYRTGSMNEVLK